jgi:hypothetical protein
VAARLRELRENFCSDKEFTFRNRYDTIAVDLLSADDQLTSESA